MIIIILLSFHRIDLQNGCGEERVLVVYGSAGDEQRKRQKTLEKYLFWPSNKFFVILYVVDILNK